MVVTARAVDYAASLGSVARRLAAYKEDVDQTVSPNDTMFTGHEGHYFAVGHSGVAAIAVAMGLSGRTGFERILDLPCGHGRVLRALRAFCPEAEIVACDIDRDGVDFCARTFGAVPLYSEEDPAVIPLEGSFDLIWVGSLLTHLDSPLVLGFFDLFEKHLAPDGLLVFTTHGRRAHRRFVESTKNEEYQAIVRAGWATGFAYFDNPGVVGYGTAYMQPSWVLAQLFDRENLQLVYYRENGWADMQDAVALVKKEPEFAYGEMMLV
jgi:SAM-dependent methyltransferase